MDAKNNNKSEESMNNRTDPSLIHHLLANLQPFNMANLDNNNLPSHSIDHSQKDYPFLQKLFQTLFANQDFAGCAFFDGDHSKMNRQMVNSKSILYELIVRQLLFDGHPIVADSLQHKIDPSISTLNLSPENTLHKLFNILYYIETRSKTDVKFSNILNWFLSINLENNQTMNVMPTMPIDIQVDRFSEAAPVNYETDLESQLSLPIPSASIGPSRQLQVAYKFGQIGNGSGCLDTPHGFCLGIDNDIVIADTNNNRICVFTLQGQFKFSFGEHGYEMGKLHQPRKIAMMPPTILAGDNQEPVFIVCDRGATRSRMQIFSVKGHFVRLIDIPSMDIVSGLTTTQDRRIIAADSVRSGVLVMDEFGTLLSWFTCSPYMIEPSDIAVHNKCFYICDFKGHCVCIFNQHGILVNRLSAKMLKFPNGIDVSDYGDIICGDSHGNRFHISVFNEHGQLVGDYDCPFVKVSRCCGLRLSQEGLIVTLAKNNHHAVVMNAIIIKTPLNNDE